MGYHPHLRLQTSGLFCLRCKENIDREEKTMLNEQQLETLRAAMDTIIPPDREPDGAPGAWDNGAGEYLLRQFQRDLAHTVTEYRLGLDALNREARTRHGVEFPELTLEQRTSLLIAIEEGEAVAPWPVSATAFLAQLVNHTSEGYYADPGQGGNPHMASWNMIGFVVTA